MNKRQKKKYLQKCVGTALKGVDVDLTKTLDDSGILVPLTPGCRYYIYRVFDRGKQSWSFVVSANINRPYGWAHSESQKIGGFEAFKINPICCNDPEQRASAFPLEGPKLSLSLPGPPRQPLGTRRCNEPT